MAKTASTSAFELAVKRSLCGERAVLATVSDSEHEFWIVPRKFSVSGMDAYTQHQARMSRGIKSDTLRAAAKKLKDKGMDVTAENLTSALTGEEMAKVLSAIPDDLKLRAPIIRIMALYGIAKHNLRGEEQEKVDEQLVDLILQSNALSNEIYEIVNGFNDFFSQAQPGPK